MQVAEPAFPVAGRGPSLLADVHYKDAHAADVLAEALVQQAEVDCRGRRVLPVFVMVGANSSTGDSLGPFAGWFLQRMGFAGLVVGDLSEPVHATNLSDKIREAWAKAMRLSRLPYIIAIDAAVGRPGRITVNRGPLRPGAGMGKSLPEVGEVHIMGGTAAVPSLLWFAGLDQTVAMAEVIASGLMTFHSRYSAARGAGSS